LHDWLAGLLAKKPARLVTVALANKLARIMLAIMTTGEASPRRRSNAREPLTIQA
jgi:transposase